MDDSLAFAKDLARQGGKLIKDNFEKSLDVTIKSDNSPVTEVDTAINKLFIDAIRSTYPEHGLLGEEADYGTGQEEYQWICDPLSGTKSFVLGVPNSTCIIGLSTQGELLLSVVYHPYTDRLYHAVKGQGAFCNDQPIKVSTVPFKSGYILTETSTTPYVEALQTSGAMLEPVDGAGYQATMLASGRVSAMVKGRYDFHDIGPASLIVQEAGGKVTDFGGNKVLFNQPGSGGLVLSNGVDHDKLLSLLF